jgi:hypothetical protein
MRWRIAFDNVYRDFRYAMRSLAKDGRFAMDAVFLPALRVGASTAVLSIFYNFFLMPLQK